MKVKFTKKDIMTIPNLMTLFRIILVPIMVVLYIKYKNYQATLWVLILSGITDVGDGFVARKFNMVSDFGKLFDPIADKITQASLALCLWTRFPNMIYIFILMAVKETIMFITGYMSVTSSGEMLAAVWHGKLNTVLFYTAILTHIVWYDIPMKTSNTILLVVACMMILSLILYAKMNIKKYKAFKE